MSEEERCGFGIGNEGLWWYAELVAEAYRNADVRFSSHGQLDIDGRMTQVLLYGKAQHSLMLASSTSASTPPSNFHLTLSHLVSRP